MKTITITIDQIKNQVYDHVRTCVPDQEVGKIYFRIVQNQFYRQVWYQVMYQVSNQVSDQINEEIQ